jgi:1-acyl-sn-glycerol-3-phosphate acyltransferase
VNRPVDAIARAPGPGTGTPGLIRGPEPNLGYLLIRYLLVWPVFRLLLRGRCAGRQHVPRRGGLVVVANHGSHLDPPLLSHAVGRPVAFMAKAELFRVPLLGAIIRACGAYPVSRGAGDREAIRTAGARLQEGWAVGVFLDGSRQADGRVHQPRPGAALLAARAGVPLLPVAILNSHRALGRGRRWPRLVPVHVRIGALVPPPASGNRADLDLCTAACQQQINALLDQGLLGAGGRSSARVPDALPPSGADPGR